MAVTAESIKQLVARVEDETGPVTDQQAEGILAVMGTATDVRLDVPA